MNRKLNILRRLAEKNRDVPGKPPVTIAFLGDSVTQGCFELRKTETAFGTVTDSQSSYIYKLKTILDAFYPHASCNVVNGGVSGSSAQHGLERLHRDILRYEPDLVVVCFGLNDSYAGTDYLPVYLSSLEKIFTAVQNSGADCIFLTPNMRSLSVSPRIVEEYQIELAKTHAENARRNVLEAFLGEASRLAAGKGIPMCDCFRKWKKFYENGVDINDLLSNFINHPTRDMHWMFAFALMDTILQNS